MTELWKLDATDLARLIRVGQASAREATESCLGRLHAVNPVINAVVQEFDAEALEAADAADAAQARGDALEKLHGVPVTIKVNVDQKGHATTHGNDIGGSVRIPAYCNGIVGLRVGLGRIAAFNPSALVARPIGSQLMAVQGPHTRTVRDARLALDVMAEGDLRDTRWVAAPLAGPPPKRPIRVALVPNVPGGFTHPAQAEAVRQAGRHLAATGYVVEEMLPPDIEAVVEVWHAIGSTDVFAVLAPQIEKLADEDTKTSMRLWLDLKPATDIKGVLGALALRDLLLQRWLTFFIDTPLVVLPTLADLPPALGMDLTREGQARVLDSLRACLIAPTLGLCGLAVPVGHHGRLRTGVQIMAGRFREDLALDAGEVIEAAEGIVVPIDPQSP